MKQILLSVCGCVCLFFPANILAEGCQIDHGKYEITMTMKTSSFPEEQLQTMIECITKEQAEAMLNLTVEINAIAGQYDNFKILEKEVEGNEQSFEATYDEGNYQGRTKTQLNCEDDKFSRSSELTTGGPNGPTITTSSMKAKRIGDCD